MDYDPYVSAGEAITGGGNEGSAASADPYVTAGQEITSQAPSSDPAPVSQANTFLGRLGIVGRAIAHGAIKAADIPSELIAKGLDASGATAGLAERMANADAARNSAYDSDPDTQSVGPQAASVLGTILSTGGPGMAAGKIAGAAGNLLYQGSRAISPITGAIGSLIPAAAEGAGAGGAIAAQIGDDPVRGALGGAVLGGVVAPAGNALGQGARAAYNALTGRGAQQAIDAQVAEAVARSGGAQAGEATPQPSASVKPPQSVGAAASGVPAAQTMTPAEIQANRVRAFNYQLAKPAPMKFDDTEYVAGSSPTVAEVTADPVLAAQYRQIAPGNAENALRLANNNSARLDHFDNLAGDAVTTANLRDARGAQAAADLQTAFGSKQPTDPTPAIQAVQGILSSPRDAENSQVQKYVAPLLSRFTNADGSLKTDPEALYGIREDIANMMSKTSQAADPNLGHVVSQLGTVKGALDGAIEAGAPGYKRYLENYATASRPIDVQELLQGFRPGLLDAKQVMQPSRVESMMKTIGKQIASPGLNPAKSLTDDDLNALWNLRADLQRQGNLTLAAPSGSATADNLRVGAAMGMDAATAGAHLLAAHVPGGNMLLGTAMDRASASASAKTKAYLANKLLSGYPTRPAP